MNRSDLATRYLGPGKVALEIAAYHNPWPANGAKVYHTCKLTREALVAMAEADPNLKGCDLSKIPHTDFVCDATTLDAVPKGWTFDAVVSSHVLEHLPDPIRAIRTWASRLNPGGVILMAVPNRDHTFDKPRHITTWEELWIAHASEMVRRTRMFHSLVEWFRLIDKKDSPEQSAREALERGDDIHFNVWDHKAMLEFVDKVSEMAGVEPFTFKAEGHEFFIVLRKK